MNTRSIGYALSWEFWGRGIYWFVPACALLVIALLAPVYAAISIRADVRVELSHAVFGIVCWVPLVMALASRGFLRRQYVLPVSTASMVGWTMANGALAAAITYCLVALVFNSLFHSDWPLWGPAWWAAVVYVIFQAEVWSVARRGGVLLVPIVFATLLAVFAGPPNLHGRLVPTSSNTGAELIWPTVSSAELATSLVAVAGFYLVSVFVVGRDRRGEAWTFVWLSRGWWAQRIGDRVFASAAVQNEFTPRSFRSPQAAQFWMEWRSKGRYVILYLAALIIGLWVFAAWNRFDRLSVSTAVSALTVMFIITTPFAGVYMGHRSERFDMKPFPATRPMSDDDLAIVVLRHASAVCGAGAIIWVIGVAATVVLCPRPLAGFPPSPHNPASFSFLKVGVFAGYLLLVWTLVALGATLGMARSWFVPVAGVGIGVLLLILVLAKEMQPLAAHAVTNLLAAGCLGGTVAAFVIARRKRLVALRTIIGALAFYFLLLACFFLALGEDTVLLQDPLEVFLRIVGVCAVPLAPLAAAPLALAWNRHR